MRVIERVEPWASIVIAVGVVAALLLNIAQFRRQAEQNAAIADNLKASNEVYRLQSLPVVSVQSVKWILDSEKLDCDNPPTGIAVQIKAATPLPVMIRFRQSLLFWYGERFLVEHQPAGVVEVGGESMIVGDIHHRVLAFPTDIVPAYYSRLSGVPGQPRLRIKASMDVRSVHSDVKYTYTVNLETVGGCGQDGGAGWTWGDESFEPHRE